MIIIKNKIEYCCRFEEAKFKTIQLVIYKKVKFLCWRIWQKVWLVLEATMWWHDVNSMSSDKMEKYFNHAISRYEKYMAAREKEKKVWKRFINQIWVIWNLLKTNLTFVVNEDKNDIKREAKQVCENDCSIN